MQNIFIAGCGYIGERLAHSYKQSGNCVSCLVRSEKHSSSLQAEGFTTIISSLDNDADIPKINLEGSILFYLVPPPGGGTVDSRARNFISHISDTGKPSKIIYMSATSVYSANNGELVNEDFPAQPDSAMGKRRLDAETAFLEYGKIYNLPVIILRVSGIYGPGRLPLMQIRQGQPLLNELESGLSNRIHADDLTTACIAAANRGENGDIFNISDGHPSSMTTYFNNCADALGFPRQPQVNLEEARQVMSPLMFSYISGSRIIDNSRMLEKLGIRLKYNSMIDGINASVPISNSTLKE